MSTKRYKADYEYYDDVGGFHSDGIGWNPNGVNCGECTKLTCKGCYAEHRTLEDFGNE